MTSVHMTLEQWAYLISDRIVWCCKDGEIWAAERRRQEKVPCRLIYRFCTLLWVFQFGLFRWWVMHLLHCWWSCCCRRTFGGDGWNDLCIRIIDPLWMLKKWTILLVVEGVVSSLVGNNRWLAKWTMEETIVCRFLFRPADLGCAQNSCDVFSGNFFQRQLSPRRHCCTNNKYFSSWTTIQDCFISFSSVRFR